MHSVAMLFAAGGLGTLARYLVSSGVQRVLPFNLPLGTFTVNFLGCLLFGLVVSLADNRYLTNETRLVVLTGFMGAFTTFSTFAFESSELMQSGRTTAACAIIIGSNVLGLIGIAVGAALGRQLQ